MINQAPSEQESMKKDGNTRRNSRHAARALHIQQLGQPSHTMSALLGFPIRTDLAVIHMDGSWWRGKINMKA